MLLDGYLSILAEPTGPGDLVGNERHVPVVEGSEQCSGSKNRLEQKNAD